MLVLSSILVPFFSKRISFEFLTLTLLLSSFCIWSAWDMPVAYTSWLMTDKLSVLLMLLSLWVSILMLMLKSTDKFLSLNIILLLMSLLALFSVSVLMSFFILFEASLIPTLCLVMGWGYQPERLEASYYFIFYTISMSMPLLASLVWLVSTSGSKYFFYDNFYEVCPSVMSLLILCVFLIKLPMFLTHLWLPKAHVEAPVVGSMILAGVLLKTGGYGIIRVFLYMEKSLVTMAFSVLGLIGMVYVCVVCLYCTDLKQLIAFSSVSHMNFMVVALMTNSLISFGGSIIMMVSHGISSSLLFFLADLSYKRCNSRSSLINKGLLMVVPTLTMFWGLAMLFNMGVPPSPGSISELLIIATCSQHWPGGLMFGLYLFLSAFYSVYLYLVTNHGNSKMTTYVMDMKEAMVSVAHILPLSGLTLMMKFMLM